MIAEKFLDEDLTESSSLSSLTSSTSSSVRKSRLPYRIVPNTAQTIFAYDISKVFGDAKWRETRPASISTIDKSISRESKLSSSNSLSSKDSSVVSSNNLKVPLKNCLPSSLNKIYKVNQYNANHKRILANHNANVSCSNRSFKRPRFSETEHSINDILDLKRSLHRIKLDSDDEIDENKPRFSETEHSINDILDLKRSLHRITLDNDDEIDENKPSSIYSPEKIGESYCNHGQQDVDKFLQTILGVDSEHLRRNKNDEGKISDLIALNYDWFNPAKPKPVQLNYVSFSHYRTTFTPLIIFDSWAQIVEEFNSSVPNRFELTEKSRRAEQYNMIVLKLSAKMPPAPKFEPVFFRYWLAIVRTNDQTPREFFGFISSCSRAIADRPLTFCIEFSKINRKNNALLTNTIKLASIQLVYYLKPSMRLMETISQIEIRSRFFRQILEPTHEVCRFNCAKTSFEFDNFEELFNDAQKKAILGSFNAVREPFSNIKIHLIQGPPGTGKTHTLVGIVKGIFANSELNAFKPLRILICAASNGAIDEIGRRLIKIRHFIQPIHGRSLQIVRLGQGSQVSDEVRPYLLETMVDRKFSAHGSDSRQTIRTNIVDNADIIISTLASCQSPALDEFRKPTGDFAFRCLIVDEASQCSEPELLMPLIYHISKVVLIGDHLQLPATIISQKASKLNYGRSLFERFYEHFKKISVMDDPSSEQHFPVITLSEQFRMHPSICQFPSDQFYSGKLTTVPGTGVNPKIPLKPYFVFDIIDSIESNAEIVEENTEIKHSKMNEIEADFIFKLLWQIFVKLGCRIIGPEFVDSMDPKDWPKPNEEESTKVKKEDEKEISVEEEYDEEEEEEEEEEKENLDEKSKQKKSKKKKNKKKKKNISPKLKFPDNWEFTIGVITFYRGQKSAITKRLKDFYGGELLKRVEVNTVDAFQGQERDVIVLSCVRAFDPSFRGSTVGFVRSKQRMNVALTRAKSALFVCISGKSFIDVPRWQELLANAQKRKRINRVTSKITDIQLCSMISSDKSK